MGDLSYWEMVKEAPSDFRVRTRVYTDPQIFEDEMRYIFEKAWVYVAHESEVRHPGDYRTAAIGRQPVIVSRGQDNKIHILLNVCRHRGNAVCREERGNSNFFRCPYHGWVYRNSGELTAITDRKEYPDDFGKDIEGLIKVPRVAVHRGLIFASLSPRGESLEEYLGEVKKYIDLWADQSPTGEFKLSRPHRLSYPGNWKFQVENGVDGHHAKYVHESAFNTRQHFGKGKVRQSFAKREVGTTRGFERGHCLLERPGLRIQVRPDLLNEYKNSLLRNYGAERVEQILNIRHILIFPNVYLMDANIRVIQPVGINKTDVYSYFVGLDGVADEINEARFSNLQERLGTTGFIGTDDLEMFAANQSGMQASAMEWVLLSRGIHREVVHPTGEREGGSADETPLRAIYRGWARIMNGAQDLKRI